MNELRKKAEEEADLYNEKNSHHQDCYSSFLDGANWQFSDLVGEGIIDNEKLLNEATLYADEWIGTGDKAAYNKLLVDYIVGLKDYERGILTAHLLKELEDGVQWMSVKDSGVPRVGELIVFKVVNPDGSFINTTGFYNNPKNLIVKDECYYDEVRWIWINNDLVKEYLYLPAPPKD